MAREEDVIDNVLDNPIKPLTDYGECLCWTSALVCLFATTAPSDEI